MLRCLFFALTVLLAPLLYGQDNPGDATGRLDQIQEQRLEKARTSGSGQLIKAKDTFGSINRIIRPFSISFEVGGLGTGAGPAVNSILRRNTYEGRVPLKMWGHLAFHNFYSVGTGAELIVPSIHDLTFALDGSYANAPQLDYYGPGPNSSIHNRTNFRREDTIFNLRASLRALPHLTEACRAAERLVHVGPGTNDGIPTTQSVFGPLLAPGIDNQSNYFIGGCSIDLDLLDFPQDPHKGTYARALFDGYNAEGNKQFSFNRLSLTGEQYVPFLNRKRVIVLRANSELSFHSDNQVVPFYLQPTLGSDTDLRGYRRYRFYDENSLSLTAEYRWEISSGFDTALFVDGGNVYHRPEQVSLEHLKSSAGFGFRITNLDERKVVVRFDVGFSREGFQIWLRIPALF